MYLNYKLYVYNINKYYDTFFFTKKLDTASRYNYIYKSVLT